ncbi:MAG: extracellular solute-binding protein [Proteobacteria bacterium]|nr:extracellular solute-binding protein [Pseudomonadota bacterium]
MRLPLTILAIAAAFLAALPLEAGARPLRIWVMHNEPTEPYVEVTPERLAQSLETLRSEHGIMIENSLRNLEAPIESQYPLGIYIIGRNAFIEELIDFQRSHPGEEDIALEFLRWDDAYSRTVAALESGDPAAAPDVVQIGSTWTATFADMGILADLSGLFDTQEFFPPSASSAAPFGSEGLFAVPWFVDARLLFYNKKIIGSPEPLATWDGFRDACEAAAPGRPLIGVPLSQNWNLLHNLAPWIWSAGGEIIRPGRFGPFNSHRVALDGAETKEAVRYLNSLSSAGCMEFPNVTQEVLDKRFIDGEYAAHIAGTWIITRMGDGWRRRFGVTLPPAGPGGSHPFVGGSHLAITAASDGRGNFDRAVELVRHFASPEVQRSYARATNFLPARREAMEGFLSDGEEVFRRGLEAGHSYPSIPDWGSVVENDLIRTHLWHIWRDIAQGVPDEMLVATVQNVASNLRRKLFVSQARRAAPLAAAGIAALMAAAAAVTALSRRRMREAGRLCEERSAELNRICAERSVLEGKALLLARRGEEQGEEVARLRREVASLGERASALKAELVRHAPRKPGDERRIGSFEIGWDGSLAIRGERVRFDNNRQARRLLEHMVRSAAAGRPALHCLWGYALFGWKAGEIQSHPQRLFEIMAAKINAQLKSHGAPALVVKSGKGSFLWRIGWDSRLVMERSDIVRSASEAELAARGLAEGSSEPSIAHAITAVELDPKNLDALAALKDALSKLDPAEPYRARMESMLKISEGMIAKDVESLRAGVREIERMASSGRVPRGMEPDDVEAELANMRCSAEYMADRFAAIFTPASGAKRPALLDDIMRRMSAIHAEISSLKARGASDETLWAQVACSGSFSQLMAVPHVSNLVCNFYNEEMKAKEDPRLVQLALISMLSQEGSIATLCAARDERDVIAAMRRGLCREIDSLSDSISTMS